MSKSKRDYIKAHVKNTTATKAAEMATKLADKIETEEHLKGNTFINYYEVWKEQYEQILKELESC